MIDAAPPDIVVEVCISESQQEALEKKFQNTLVDVLSSEDATIVVRPKNQKVKLPPGEAPSPEAPAPEKEA